MKTGPAHKIQPACEDNLPPLTAETARDGGKEGGKDTF